MQPQNSSSTAPAQGSERRQMRPTLLVGLGGTGQEVLVRVKARFLETFGSDALRVIKMAALDTVGLNREIPISGGRMVRLDRNTEFLDIGNVPTVQVVQNLDTAFPQIKAWLPSNLPGQAITQGAQMIRPLGRLAFFFHFRKIHDYFHGLISALSSIHGEYLSGKVSRDEEPGLNIILVSSICGGTGSGIFLDTAYLLHYLCERLNQPRINVNGILALPQVFAMVSSDQIKANAFAALRELDQFTNGSQNKNFEVEYPGGNIVRNGKRPFNICYLVDGVNEQGRVLAGMGEFAPLIAESIFMQVSSQIGTDAAAAFDNLKTINSSVPAYDAEGVPHMTAFSGMGMSSLHFPAAAIIDVCGRRFAARLITQGLLTQPPAATRIESELDKLLNLLQVRNDQLLAMISRDDLGRPLVLDPAKTGLNPALLETVSKSELVAQVGARAQRFDNEILSDSLRKQLDRNFKSLEASLSAQLDDAVARLLEDLTSGLLLIKPLFTAMRANLSETSTLLDRRRKEQQESLENSGKPITVAHQRLGQALEAWVDLGDRRRKEATIALVAAHTRQFQMRFELMRLDCAVRVLAALTNAVDRHLRGNEALLDRLRVTAEKFQRDDQEKTRQWDASQDALNQMITDANDLEVLYQEYVSDVRQQLRNLVEPGAAGPVHTWNERYPTYEQISSVLLSFAQSVFTPIGERKLENEIMRRDAISNDVRVEKCVTAATPFWSVQVARVPNGGSDVEEITVIGVEDQETTIYKERLKVRGSVGTTTRDPHRITVLRTKHGVPIHALGHYDEYLWIYNRYMESQRVPLHIMPMPDVKQARRAFALAQSLNVIIEEGGVANYVVRATRPGAASTPLAKGLPQAVQFLSGNARLVVEVEQQAEAEIMRLGKDEARNLIDAYIARPLSSETDRQKIEHLLNELVADYRQRYL